MRNYEITFIVDPVLSGDEIKAAAQTYVDMLQEENCKIVHVDEMGLRQLAYPINKRNSGVYYCIEFEVESGEVIGKLELAMQRDERLVRFLTVKLDKYGVKYNADKRAGLIVKKKKDKKDKETKEEVKKAARKDAPRKEKKEAPAPEPKQAEEADVATEEE
jgi:small subunit ribosomal protein S6